MIFRKKCKKKIFNKGGKDPDPDDIPEELSNYDSYMVCEKNSFLNIVNYSKIEYDKSFHGVIIDVIERTNKIVCHTYQFLKLYFLYLFDNDKEFPLKENIYPKINTQLIKDIMNVITIKNQTRGRKSTDSIFIEKLKNFYEEYYKPMLSDNDIILRDNLKSVLNYEEMDIIKNIKTNISEHFMSHLRFFIKVKYGFDKQLDKIKNSKKLNDKQKKEERTKIYSEWNNIIGDIINVTDNTIQSDDKYSTDIYYFREAFIPNKISYDKKSIPYDVTKNPLDYVLQMILLNRELELINRNIIIDHNNPKKAPPVYRLFNAFPLRKSIVPKYITLDTVCLIDLFIVENSKLYRENIGQYKDLVWNRFFKTKSRSFKRKGYKFNYIIKTNGIACSIILIKVDPNGIPIEQPSKFDENNNSKESKMKYIEETEITESFKKKSIVVCDPGKDDLGTFMDENGNYFRYTQKQRNHATKKRKYEKIREELSKKKVNNKTIKEIESGLTNYDSKTCDFNGFKNYLAKKIEINSILFDNYKKMIHRKLKWNNYINTRRNEDIMLNNFKKKMGDPKETIMIFGDWSDKGMKNKEPSISKKLRRIFMDRKYECYLIDEHKTSKICNSCHKETSNLEIAGKRMWKLVRCNSCGSIHNRDHNATKNMMLITKEIIKDKERPKVFINKYNQER
jgi:hypothetical protein